MKTFVVNILLSLLAVAAVSCSPDAKAAEDMDPENVFLTVHTPSVNVYADSASGEVEITCNGSWSASSDSDWIEIKTVSGKGEEGRQTIAFVPSENMTGAERTGLIEIIAKGCYETVMVTQSAASGHSISNFFKEIHSEDFAKVYICAHRANTWSGIYQDYLPENSIPAVKRCIELGIDMVEIDVRMTKDGVLVCCHDAYIDKVTNGKGNISDMTYSQICSYDLKSREKGVVSAGVKMPTLEELLLECKDRIWVNLDLAKTTISPSEVVSVIEKAGMLDQVTCYTGSDADLAKSYYRLCDRLSVHLSVSSSGGVGSISGMNSTSLFQIGTAKYWDGTTASASLSSSIRNLGYCSFSNLLNYDSQVMGGNTAALEAFCDARIDFLQTDIGDHPNVMNLLQEKGLR